MADVTLDNVTKHFDDGNDTVVAVEDLDLAIDDGEFVVIVGPSGCGKTTTLRMIAGLESVTAGEIRIAGEDVTDRSPQQRDIAMVFQSYALYPHMTVRQNMSFGLQESTDLGGDEIDEKVETSAAMLDIGELLDRKPEELSGGQQQRVALGRAIVRDPAVFLMDEPLSNLDAKLRSQMRTELQRLQEELATTTIYVTHDQTEAMTMGDRIVILNDGELQQVGTPVACYHEPENRFVAGFIGEPSMNFLDVERQGSRLVAEGFEYELSEDLRRQIGDVTDLTIGIRPDDIEIGRGRGQGPEREDGFESEIDVVERVGRENNVYLLPPFDVDNDEDALVAIVDGDRQLSEGSVVWTRLPEDALHVFDQHSGEALRNRQLETVEPVS